jgi:hypothetical protein
MFPATCPAKCGKNIKLNTTNRNSFCFQTEIHAIQIPTEHFTALIFHLYQRISFIPCKMKMIPRQRNGVKSATTYTIKLPAVSSAKELFQKAKRNLLNVNKWHQFAGESSAVFRVVNSRGEETNDFVKEGNYLRITIPVIPGSPAGRGDDWVKVERINEYENLDYEYVGIRVRPAVPPFQSELEVAHFFGPEATSTFSIERHQNTVTAAVNGKNEKPNTSMHTILSRIRNFFVAIGAMIGFNKPQWKSLVKGLVSAKYE